MRKFVLINLGLISAALLFGQEMKINVITWNHMCQGDAFAADWGTPKEILLTMDKYKLDTQEQITDTQKLEANTARFMREAQFLKEQNFDMLLLQESEDISREIFQKNTNYKMITASAQDSIFINSKSLFWKNPYVKIKPYIIDLEKHPDFKDKVDGIACAVVTVKREKADSYQLVFCSTHAKSGKVKGIENIRIFESGLKGLINKEFPDYEVIVGGDYNLDFNKEEINPVFSADWNVLVPKGKDWFDNFTTQHEFNFFGAFDGFLITPKDPSVPIVIDNLKRIVAGLMPKYLGKGPVTGHGKDFGDSILQYDNQNELTRADTKEVIPGCNAKTQAMSDHCPVEITITFNE